MGDNRINKTKAKSLQKMISKLFLVFIFIIPLLGKNIDYSESIIFYSIPSIIFLFLLFKKQKFYLSAKNIIFQLILIVLFLISVLFSKNIGSSYYQFFIFLNTILIVSLTLNIIKPEKFSSGLIISSFIYSIIFLLNKFGILNIIKDPLNDNFILQNWGHSYVVELLVISIPILLHKIFYLKEKKIIPIAVIIFTSLFLTNSRSALIALIIISFFLKLKEKKDYRFKTSFIIICVLGLIIGFFQIKQKNQQQKTYDGNRPEYWQQSINGFKKAPILGTGPNTFSYTNKKFQTDVTVVTPYAHNSLLNFLSENGIIFTSILFTLIIIFLYKTSKINNLFFVCGLLSLIYSFIDFSWNSPGIFIISLYLIFYYPFSKSKNKNNKFTPIYLFIITLIILFFTFSKILSDILFLRKDYQKSISIDPFNINSRLEIIKTNTKDQLWQKNLETTLKIYNNETIVYENLTNIISLPESEKYFYKLMELNPENKINLYLKLADFYKDDNQKFNDIIDNLNNLIPNTSNNNKKISLSKFYYHYALDLFSTNPKKSIEYFQKTVYLVPTLGYFHIDLANAFWHTNQKDQAINQLKNICQQYPQSKQQCQEYLQAHQNSNFNHPGQTDFVEYINILK